jgi:hypothetical protein
MDGPQSFDDIARGVPEKKLRIAGRPRQGACEIYVILEEPKEPPVLVHFADKLMPHYRRNCPYCKDAKQEPKPYWYLGAFRLGSKERVLLELTEPCWRVLEAAAKEVGLRPVSDDLFDGIEEVRFAGLEVEIHRGDYKNSARVLRCNKRVSTDGWPAKPWPYRTRDNLARIWGVPFKPRIYREDQA